MLETASRKLCALVAVFAGLMFIGCTTYVESKRIGNPTKPERGVVYSLPMLQYEINFTKRITECKPIPVGNSEDETRFVKIAIVADITERIVQDPDATFVLDYTKLSRGTKTFDFYAEMHKKGYLKTLNASSRDETAKIIENAFTSVASIALTAAGVVPRGVGVALEMMPLQVCTEPVHTALEKLAETDQEYKNRAKAVNAAISKLRQIRLKIAALPESTEKALQELKEAIEKLDQAEDSLKKITKARAPFVEVVEKKERILWPQSGDERKRTIGLSEDVKKAWFTGEALERKVFTNGPTANVTIEKLIIREANVFLQIKPLLSRVSGAKIPATIRGVVYRHAVPAKLEICRYAKCGNPDSQTMATTSDEDNYSLVPQMGPVAFLPFENSAFENNILKASFSEEGTLFSVTYKEQQAAAVEATGAVAKVAQQLPSLRQSIETAELEELKRETELVNQEAELLKQKKSLLDAESDLGESPIADFEAQTALVKAELELEKAKLELKKLKKELELSGKEEDGTP